MFGGGRGMGSGAGSGNMLRLAGRAVTTARAGVTNHLQDPVSSPSSSNTNSNCTSPRATHKFTSGSSNTSNCLSLSSGSGPGTAFPAHNAPVSANSSFNYGWPSPFSGEDYEWVSVDGNGEEKPPPPGDDFLVGPVPSLDEVTSAVSALTQVFGASSYSQFVRDKFPCTADKDVMDQISSPTGLLRRASSVGAELDWLEPSPHLCNPRMLHSYGSDRVYDAFHLLQTEPSVQRMVISLSSDQAVWDAVLNNEVVQELRETCYAADENLSPPSSEVTDETHDNSNPAIDVIRWIRAKFVEVFEKITKLVNELFKPTDDGKTAGATDLFEQRMRTSFLLSIVVLLVVVVTRGQKA